MPRQLLAAILDIEKEMGRRRVQKKGPRTLDIDILLFGNSIVKMQGTDHTASRHARAPLRPRTPRRNCAGGAAPGIQAHRPRVERRVAARANRRADFGPRTSDLRRRTSDFGLLTAELRASALDLTRRTRTFTLVWFIRPRVREVRRPTSDLRRNNPAADFFRRRDSGCFLRKLGQKEVDEGA